MYSVQTKSKEESIAELSTTGRWDRGSVTSIRRRITPTRPAYARGVQEFAQFLAGRGKSLQDATPVDAEAFTEQVLKATYAMSTVAKKISELRQTYRAHTSASNPFEHIHVQVPDKTRTGNRPDETEHLLREMLVTTAKQVRDAALLALSCLDRLLTCQLRELNVDDVDLEAGTVKVRTRGGQRLIFLSQQTLPHLRRWLALRRRYQLDTPALFIALHWTSGRGAPHARMSSRGVYAVRALYTRRANQETTMTARLNCSSP